MSTNDIHGVEPGWSVKTLDGQEAGSVEETTDRYILVKSGLLSPEHRYLPAATLEHVRPELREIGISITGEELEAGDWSTPPDHGPRREGAPLNAGATGPGEVEEDIVLPRAIEEPEKPAHL